MKKLNFILFILVSSGLLSSKCQTSHTAVTAKQTQTIKNKTPMDTSTVIKSEEEWRKILTDEEYHVLREAGTDRAFTGKYTDYKSDGNYYCKACGNLLFTSDTKYHSGCGWPAFYDNAGNSAVENRIDNSFGMTRVEVVCKKCKSHLGHIFEDGPKDKTGLRYCINSTSIDFATDSTKTKQ